MVVGDVCHILFFVGIYMHGVIYPVLFFFLHRKIGRNFVRKTNNDQTPPDLMLRVVREVKLHNIVI